MANHKISSEEQEKLWKKALENQPTELSRMIEDRNSGYVCGELEHKVPAWTKVTHIVEKNGDITRLETPSEIIKPVTSSWLEKAGKTAYKNVSEGPIAVRAIRGLGIGIGAMYTVSGAQKLLSTQRQLVGEDGMEQPAPNKGKALLELAAGAGIIAASLFISGGKSAAIAR